MAAIHAKSNFALQIISRDKRFISLTPHKHHECPQLQSELFCKSSYMQPDMTPVYNAEINYCGYYFSSMLFEVNNLNLILQSRFYCLILKNILHLQY